MKTEPTSARTSRRSAGLQSALNLALVIVILLAVNYLGFKYYAHRDLSAAQFYTLSGKTRNVLKRLDAPVHIITMLVNKQNVQYWDQTESLLKEYQRVGGQNVTFDKVDPVYDRARAVELQNRLHFSGNDNLIIFEYKDRSRLVKQDDLLDQNPQTGEVGGYKGEQQFTGAILALIEGKSSKIYFTAGHGEHPFNDTQAPEGYGPVVQQLKGENAAAADLNLAASGTVPADADAVVVAGPSVPFSPGEAQALDRYLAAGGKLFLLLDPLAPSGLDSVLKKYGLSFDDDIVLYRTMNSTGEETTVPLALIYQNGFAPHPITEKFPAAGYYLAIADARSVHLQPDNSPVPKVQPLLSTSPDAWGWLINPGMSTTDLSSYSSRTFNHASDLAGPLAVAAAYDGGPMTNLVTKAPGTGTRLVLVGSAHFLEKDTVDAVGANFFVNVIDWLVKQNAVLDISPKQPQQYGVSLSPMSQRTVTWTALIFVPGLALALGIFTWFSRRK